MFLQKYTIYVKGIFNLVRKNQYGAEHFTVEKTTSLPQKTILLYSLYMSLV